MKKIFWVVCIIICFMIGCQSPAHPKEVSNAPALSNQDKQKPFNPSNFHNEPLKKLSLPFDQFSAVSEWFNDETILYITNEGSGSVVHSFHLISGETEVFYKSEELIMSVEANKTYDMFLVRSAVSSTEGILRVLSDKGEELAEWKFDNSIDLVYSWNPFSAQQLVVSSFKEDWSYETFLLDVHHKSMIKKDVADPFVQWLPNEEIGYIDWNHEMPALEAPLYAEDLGTEDMRELKESVVMFHTYDNHLITAGSVDDVGTASYSFYSFPELEVMHSYEAPLLTLYSNYFIPYYDFEENTKIFYTFESTRAGSADGYSDGFQLISFDSKSGEKKVLAKDLENAPLKCSPNGVYCLYGYQLEQIIIPSTKEIVNLVELS
ncbi:MULTISPECIES: YqgU-like beta propeller domain-containing protein [Bacillaceae]|uniref:YqgU-like 6-bladed beta-propeller domain-containing protein n=1 Tax=Sutcliffiella horikoshii TaxID=79883 RepID=A0A5D4TEZ6_9BACI|nr:MULTISPECIES: hypothetical protein [Bacillaceae]TYS74207.1 hypothetical protein FZC75_00405 [Sutcliffiella horikoshii]